LYCSLATECRDFIDSNSTFLDVMRQINVYHTRLLHGQQEQDSSQISQGRSCSTLSNIATVFAIVHVGDPRLQASSDQPQNGQHQKDPGDQIQASQGRVESHEEDDQKQQADGDSECGHRYVILLGFWQVRRASVIPQKQSQNDRGDDDSSPFHQAGTRRTVDVSGRSLHHFRLINFELT